jgi:hypothetical protein
MIPSLIQCRKDVGIKPKIERHGVTEIVSRLKIKTVSGASSKTKGHTLKYISP